MRLSLRVALLMIAGCSALACAVEKEMPSDNGPLNSLAPEDRAYVLSMYAGKPQFFQFVAVSIRNCRTQKEIYEKTESVITTGGNTVALLAAEKAVEFELNVVSSIWQSAINEQQDFNEFVSMRHTECKRVGTVEALGNMRRSLAKKMAALNQTKYRSTLEAFATTEALADLAVSPRGSLFTYNATVNTMDGEFTKQMALAKLEEQKK